MGEAKTFTDPLFDFVRDVRTIQTFDVLNAKFRSVVERYGFDVFLCTELIGRGGEFRPLELFGKWNRQWEARYFSREYFRHDACLQHLASAHHGFTWSDVKASGSIAPKGQRILDEVTEYRSREGILVPIRSFDKQLSVVSLMGENVDVSDDALAAIEVASIYFCETGRRLFNAGIEEDNTVLTERQLEVVKWLVTGKRYDDIADILNISVKTVHRHMDDAKARLNVVTRDQVVLAAFRAGLIEI